MPPSSDETYSICCWTHKVIYCQVGSKTHSGPRLRAHTSLTNDVAYYKWDAEAKRVVCTILGTDDQGKSVPLPLEGYTGGIEIMLGNSLDNAVVKLTQKRMVFNIKEEFSHLGVEFQGLDEESAELSWKDLPGVEAMAATIHGDDDDAASVVSGAASNAASSPAPLSGAMTTPSSAASTVRRRLSGNGGAFDA